MIDAVNLFCQRLASDEVISKYSRVSLIAYDGSAYILTTAEDPSKCLAALKNVKPDGNSTAFDPALEAAAKILEKYQAKFECFTLMMLTDGGANFPDNGVSKIKSLPSILPKLKFQAICYGSDSSGAKVLQNLAKEIAGGAGQFLTILDAEKLNAEFISLIPNLD